MPSTPNSRSIRTAPSTTPAGPPPSWMTSTSTTPAGPPPASTLGSSYNPSNNTFPRNANSFSAPTYDDDFDEDAPGGLAGLDELYDDIPSPPTQSQRSFTSSIPPARAPRGMKRSRDGRPRPGGQLAMVARGRVGRSKPAPVREADNVILQSERTLGDLDAKVHRERHRTEAVLVETAAQFTKIWSHESDAATRPGSIGPKSADPFTQANYLATLLLQLHHPHTDTPRRGAVRIGRSAADTPLQYGVSVPRALLDWLDTYHRPFPDDFQSIHHFQPAPSAHESYWDVVYANLLRGKIDRVIRLLKDAGWRHADTALDDGSEDPGYSGHQLEATDEVVSQCVAVLYACPGYQNANWDVKGLEWSIWRNQVDTALTELETFAEGDRAELDQSEANLFARSARHSNMSLSTASRRAQMNVPWSIYENVKLLYGLLMGSPEEILMTSQDWLEGALYLTIWWDGSDADPLEASVNKSSMRKTNTQKAREVDVTPLPAYRNTLADAFVQVTTANSSEEDVFSVDTTDLMQLGLACIMEDSVGSVVRILRTLSMPIAVSVVEVASVGGWLPSVRPRSSGGLSQGLSKEDLLVLSYGAPTKSDPDEIDRDEILGEYADLLGGKDKVQDREGWELAVAVLNRLDQAAGAQKQIADMIERIELVEESRVDKVLDVCDGLGQTEQRRHIAERFADSLADPEKTNPAYGSALIYYARAHATTKLKETLALLTSFSLLHSASIPVHKLLDTRLGSLISKDRPALKDLAKQDMEAATLLASHLSGYATLRSFYDLRDQDIYSEQGIAVESSLKSLERRRQAASALFAVIKSAADCIPGGLYDPEVESVIPVDGLLVLFGEALPLLGSGTRVFTEKQVFALLGIVEDFVASPSRIRENADSLLAASLTAFQEGANTASGVFRRKEKERDLRASSSWDMMATSSMMVTSQGLGKNATIQRSWDWRQGLVGAVGVEQSAEQVVRLLREALVREVAGGWSGRLNW